MALVVIPVEVRRHQNIEIPTVLMQKICNAESISKSTVIIDADETELDILENISRKVLDLPETDRNTKCGYRRMLNNILKMKNLPILMKKKLPVKVRYYKVPHFHQLNPDSHRKI
jgi:hypothetical protein